MTRHKSFKRLVRTRMEKTGESYTAARAMLLAAEPSTGHPEATARHFGRRPSGGAPGAAGRSGSTCSTSSARPSVPTGRSRAGSPISSGSSRWCGRRRPSRQLRARSRPACRRPARRRLPRSPHRRPWTFPPSGSSTRSSTRRNAGRGCRTESCGNAPRPGRDRPATTGRVVTPGVMVTFDAKGPGKSTVAVQHARLADAEDAERKKLFWRERLTALKSQLEAGETDA